MVIEIASRHVRGVVADISSTGVFIRCDDADWILDAPVAFGLMLPGGTVRIRGTVVWIREAKRGGPPAGIGVRFGELDRGVDKLIETLVTKLSAKNTPELDYTPPDFEMIGDEG